MKNKTFVLLFAGFQLAIIAGMLVKAMLPLLTGHEMLLPIEARDPRDLFRGNYVVLGYEFDQILLDSLPNDIAGETRYHFGDQLYLELEKRGRFHHPAGLWQHPPEGKPYMQAIVDNRYGIWVGINGAHMINLKCGIDSYFTDPAAALAMQDRLRENLRDLPDEQRPFVSVMVSGNGTARIKSVTLNPAE